MAAQWQPLESYWKLLLDFYIVQLKTMSILSCCETRRSFYISIFEIYTERGKTEKLFDLLPGGGELSMQQSTIKGLQEV